MHSKVELWQQRANIKHPNKNRKLAIICSSQLLF